MRHSAAAACHNSDSFAVLHMYRRIHLPLLVSSWNKALCGLVVEKELHLTCADSHGTLACAMTVEAGLEKTRNVRLEYHLPYASFWSIEFNAR